MKLFDNELPGLLIERDLILWW